MCSEPRPRSSTVKVETFAWLWHSTGERTKHINMCLITNLAACLLSISHVDTLTQSNIKQMLSARVHFHAGQTVLEVKLFYSYTATSYITLWRMMLQPSNRVNVVVEERLKFTKDPKQRAGNNQQACHWVFIYARLCFQYLCLYGKHQP